MATTWTITKREAFNIESELNADLFVEAIKSFRAITGADLYESKSIIEYRRDWGDWPITVKIKGEEEEELVANTSLPPEMRSIESMRELLCQALRNNIEITNQISCNQHACDVCSLNTELHSDDFLINLVNLPLNKE